MISLQQIKAVVQQELADVDDFIQSQLSSHLNLVQDIGHHLIDGGGKRLRPLVVLLSSGCFDCQGSLPIRLAAIIEFFHTSSLLHDDVVDHSDLRRGQKTANTIWGNKASVLVGDFIFSQAFQMMVAIERSEILTLLASTSNAITQGEIEQLMHCHNPDLSETHYLRIIGCKTAAMFEAAAQMGPLLAQSPSDDMEAMRLYGRHLGYAFQMVDDALDYQSSSDVLGKNIGDDLAEGKVTLPLLYAMKHIPSRMARDIKQALAQGEADLDVILQAIEQSDAVSYTHQRAEQEIDRAVTALLSIPASPYRDALEQLACFNLDRSF